MTKLQNKIASGMAGAAMLIASVAPYAVAADVTLQVSGNGSDSQSTVDVQKQSNTQVNQTNFAEVDNKIDVSSNTGDNEIEDNTGGNIDLETGNANQTVVVSNKLNSNVADVEECDCEGGETDVLIEGNGTNSTNRVDLEQRTRVDVDQFNAADVWNNVDHYANTGRNDIEDNTGADIEADTGNATATTVITTEANSNWATVGGSNGNNDGQALSARILGNGSDSRSNVDLAVARSTRVGQTNFAEIDNDVETDLYTGKNDIEDNTGGEIDLETGNADAGILIENSANFNAAALDDCGCILDVLAKVDGNGTDSVNRLAATLRNNKVVDQFNGCGEYGIREGFYFGEGDCFENEVDVTGKTGKNDIEDNTGEADSDPALDTGNFDAYVEVMNEGGANYYGTAPESDWEMPESMGGNMNINVSFNLEDLVGALASLLGA